MNNCQRSLSIAEKISQGELVGLIFELVPVADVRLFPDYVKGLHAWFLSQMQHIDPDLSAYLHDGQSEKPFTVSRLEGPLENRGKEIYFTAQQTYRWHLTLLSSRVVTGVSTWLTQTPSSLELARNRFNIQSINLFLPCLTYKDLWQGSLISHLELSFVSPTSFRRQGNHFPLPVPNNLFHSYLRRWNDFSGYEIDSDDFLKWVDESVRIDRHWLESLKVIGIKGGNVTGFIGAIALSVSPEGRKNGIYTQLFSALGQLSPYCGTGHKTTFGLGKTQRGWNLPETNRPPLLPEITKEQELANRIESLTNTFLQQQKRPESKRAITSCQTKANILARRELGESLQAIAIALEMPYETVKTYAKRGRQQLSIISLDR